MCRPLWAAWVDDKQVLSVPGEGSHSELINHTVRVGPGKIRWDFDIMASDTFHPFEAVWTRKREAQWQPNTSRFYSMDDMPTRKHFDLAQERFEKDMGTPDKLRDWVLAGAKLFGEEEAFPVEDDAYPKLPWIALEQQSLLDAAMMIVTQSPQKQMTDMLCTRPAKRTEVNGLYLRTLGRPVAIHSGDFHLWADMFSDRKNRVDLWKN